MFGIESDWSEESLAVLSYIKRHFRPGIIEENKKCLMV